MNSSIPFARRKKLGAFYTPDTLSSVLADWAITDASAKVLEPGFGGCGFLEAAIKRLTLLGCKRPTSRLYGCDIDQSAFHFLKERVGLHGSLSQFPKIDFLKTKPNATWSTLFNAVIGNPPYVAYQNLSKTQRHDYQNVLAAQGIYDVSPRASLWAYFVLHAHLHLKRGGRVAWVLPGSMLHSQYANSLQSHLIDRFETIDIYHIHDRLFEPVGASEETVVLLGAGYGLTPKRQNALVISVPTVDALAEALAKPGSANSKAALHHRRSFNGVFPGHPFEARPLGELLKARIGLVTGDNPFFILTPSRKRELKLTQRGLQGIFAKPSASTGIVYNKSDHSSAMDRDYPTYLVSPKTYPVAGTQLRNYLNRYPRELVQSISTYKKRKIWYSPADKNVPDAFWPVMRDLGPRIIINKAGVHCTNTIHRIFFNSQLSATQRKAICISLQSTFSQVSAELVGRSYGSGVLKHEPREVEKIEVILPPRLQQSYVTQVFNAINKAMRNNDHKAVMDLADEFIFRSSDMSVDAKLQRALRDKLHALRRLRNPRNSSKTKK